MEKQGKRNFAYLPQIILGVFALAALGTAVYFLSTKPNDQIIESKTLAATEKTLPGLTILEFQNKDVALTDLLTGDKHLLIFWATWCGPCVDEMKEMPKLLPKIKAKGYLPIFVNYDQPENKVIANNFAKKYGVESTFDLKGELLYSLGISALPVSLVVEKSGKILRTLQGEINIDKL